MIKLTKRMNISLQCRDLLRQLVNEQGERRNEPLLDFCVEYSHHDGEFLPIIGLGERPDVHAHYLKWKANKLRDEASDLEAGIPRLMEESDAQRAEATELKVRRVLLVLFLTTSLLLLLTITIGRD